LKKVKKKENKNRTKTIVPYLFYVKILNLKGFVVKIQANHKRIFTLLTDPNSILPSSSLPGPVLRNLFEIRKSFPKSDVKKESCKYPRKNRHWIFEKSNNRK
jgi:hypothetical protein